MREVKEISDVYGEDIAKQYEALVKIINNPKSYITPPYPNEENSVELSIKSYGEILYHLYSGYCSVGNSQTERYSKVKTRNVKYYDRENNLFYFLFLGNNQHWSLGDLTITQYSTRIDGIKKEFRVQFMLDEKHKRRFRKFIDLIHKAKHKVKDIKDRPEKEEELPFTLQVKKTLTRVQRERKIESLGIII